MSKRHRSARHARSATQEIYGVRLSYLVDMFAELYGSAEPTADGQCAVTLTASDERVEPLLRALLRAEAELLIADAARPDLSVRQLRSTANRGYDALMLLTWRTLAARGVPDCEGDIRAVLDDAAGAQAR